MWRSPKSPGRENVMDKDGGPTHQPTHWPTPDQWISVWVTCKYGTNSDCHPTWRWHESRCHRFGSAAASLNSEKHQSYNKDMTQHGRLPVMWSDSPTQSEVKGACQTQQGAKNRKWKWHRLLLLLLTTDMSVRQRCQSSRVVSSPWTDMKVEWILYMLMMDNLASMNQQIEGSLSLLLWINMHTDISEKCRWPLNHLY